MLRSALSSSALRATALARPLSTFRSTYGLWIDGKEQHRDATFEVEDPATTKPLTTVSSASADDVAAAVQSGKKAFDSGVWSKADPRDRAAVLTRCAELLAARVPEFAELESIQTGRAIREMRAQLGRLPEWFEYFAALARTAEGSVTPFKGPYINYVKRIPLGVVGQVTPWNHPLLIALKKIAPALAAGNSVVVKPSELAPVTVLETAALCTEAGLPDGVLNIVPGMGVEAGAALVSQPTLAKLDLTGGTPTGRVVAAAAGEQLTPVIAELGGKAPVIIFEDADIDAAINGAAFAGFIASGQTCIAGTRVLVHESKYEEVSRRFAEKASRIKLGPPMDMTTQMGPVISAPQLEKIVDFVASAKAEGARVLTGGKQPQLPDELASGYYYEPTVLGDCTPDMRAVREEIFGPVIVTYPFKDEADAIKLANDSPFGLAAAVWTRDVARAHRVAEEMDVGIVWINDHHRNDPSSPWGGMKDSGMGRENGIEALHEYSQTRSVVVNMSDEPFDWFVDEEGVRYS
eukprot:PLAT6821.2.p2 GENE.PLAT6821.2~~PLAT6821.2.p2  ORF type:complete len:530 (+),score=268.50 PLAT6821.2:31-1590(+)